MISSILKSYSAFLPSSLVNLCVSVGVNHWVTKCFYLVFLSHSVRSSKHKSFHLIFMLSLLWQSTYPGSLSPFLFSHTFFSVHRFFSLLERDDYSSLCFGSDNPIFPLTLIHFLVSLKVSTFPHSSSIFASYLITCPFHSTECLFPVRSG